MKTAFDENLPLSEQTYFILLSLGSSPKHGYAIAKDIELLSNGRVLLSVSTLYTILKRLLEADWIRLTEETSKNSNRPRKTYELTNPGGRILNAEVKRLKALVSAARLRKVERVI